MSREDTKKLEHTLDVVAGALDAYYNQVAIEIDRHAVELTLPRHADIARWASCIDFVKTFKAAIEREIDLSKTSSVRLQ